LYDRSVLAKAIRFLLAKVQILTKYTMCHFVQNDKIQVLLPVPCSLFPVPCSRLPCRPGYKRLALRNDGFAGTGQAAFPTERWLRRNGTSRVPYEKMASPERDEPRSLQKDGFAVTGQSLHKCNSQGSSCSDRQDPSQKRLRMTKPRSCSLFPVPCSRLPCRPANRRLAQRKYSFAGTGRATFPTKRSLRRYQ
jgi:hypothetical protein